MMLLAKSSTRWNLQTYQNTEEKLYWLQFLAKKND